MKVLVTGGSGFIGSHVVDKLVDAGHDPVIFDRVVSPWHDPERVPTFRGSLGDLCALERAMDALLVGEVAAHGSRLGADAVRALLSIDIPLNAAGLAAWLRASARPAGR